jgi:hypothetical protein
MSVSAFIINVILYVFNGLIYSECEWPSSWYTGIYKNGVGGCLIGGIVTFNNCTAIFRVYKEFWGELNLDSY